IIGRHFVVWSCFATQTSSTGPYWAVRPPAKERLPAGGNLANCVISRACSRDSICGMAMVSAPKSKACWIGSLAGPCTLAITDIPLARINGINQFNDERSKAPCSISSTTLSNPTKVAISTNELDGSEAQTAISLRIDNLLSVQAPVHLVSTACILRQYTQNNVMSSTRRKQQ